jgi:hypothetical protein
MALSHVLGHNRAAHKTRLYTDGLALSKDCNANDITRVPISSQLRILTAQTCMTGRRL